MTSPNPNLNPNLNPPLRPSAFTIGAALALTPPKPKPTTTTTTTTTSTSTPSATPIFHAATPTINPTPIPTTTIPALTPPTPITSSLPITTPLPTNHPKLPDEQSDPFFKGIGVAFVAVDGDTDECDLCAYARDHPPPPAPTESLKAADDRWGIPHHIVEQHTLCKVQDENEQHAFHVKCLRAFVAGNKKLFRNEPNCPSCGHMLDNAGQTNENKDGDDVSFSEEDVGGLGGKARKRDQQMYSCWVHIIQATGLKKPGSNTHISPVCYVSAFGRTLKSEVGDHGNTFACVWDQAFSFTGKFDSDSITRQTISLRIEDYHRIWSNTLIGSVQFQAQHVNAQPNHEFYRQWTPIVHVGGKETQMEAGMQGSIQISVCVLSEADIIANPRLPLHVYDLEVQMWADGKKAIPAVDVGKHYLQDQVDEQKALDAMRTSHNWDLIHVRVYRGDDMPKVDKFSGWCDGFVELSYKGLLQNKNKLVTSVQTGVQPIWNHEFTIPIVSGVPVFYNRFDLLLKDYNKLQDNTTLGGCWFNITDILALGANSKPFWKNLYEDIDGRPPYYRGRILVQFSVELNVSQARIGSTSCTPLSVALMPPTGSYKLDIEMYEGSLLGGSYNDYQVDVAWAHPMKGGENEREKAGKAWTTFTSQKIGGKQRVVPFLTRQTVIAHNLPYPDAKVPEKEQPSSPSTPRPRPPISHGYTGDAAELTNSTSTITLQPDTCQSDYLSQIPDIIIYVSKKGDRKSGCVGYLRIPVSGVTRPTENWEHGQDLTIFPNLFDARIATPRCLPLKPLKEVYEIMYGFLLFKLSITPISHQEAQRALAAPAPSPLPAIPRQTYQLIANIYQAKDLASVDASGLSSPFATVRIMDVHVQTQPKPNTCYPLWFQSLTATVELPVDLTYAPDISVTLFHHRPNQLFRWGDPSIFMGKADITAITAHPNNTHMAWYPLQFEEHSYGDVCCSFLLTPMAEANSRLRTPADDMASMVEKWETWNIDVQALAIRGILAQQLTRIKKDARFELEAWGHVQSFTQSQVINHAFTVKLRKPTNPIFYSSINIRIYNDTQLIGVTSIPIEHILKSGLSWYRCVELLMRTPERLIKKYVNKWKRCISKEKKSSASGGVIQGKKNKYQRHSDIDTLPTNEIIIDIDQHEQHEDKSAISDHPTLHSSPDSYGHLHDDIDMVKAKTAAANALLPRQLDKDGNEIVAPEQIQKLSGDIPQVEKKMRDEDLWDRVWRTECEYESLPLTKEPFDSFPIYIGKDEIHQTFLEKLFVRSKHNVGMLRGAFHATRVGKHKGEDEKTPRVDLFDAERYTHPQSYQIRVYLLRGLQLQSRTGTSSECDPFIRVTLGDDKEIQKTNIVESNINPQFYQCLTFGLTQFPGESTTLKISAWNDSGLFGEDLIGESTLDLENRLFSRTWWNMKRPIERRALFTSKHGRLPRGYIEVCIDIVPESRISDHSLDFLLNPPKRQDWELRCILWQTRKVTPKKIYHHDDDCCCTDLCAPPNQSDLQLVCGFCGSKEKPSHTDIHLRCIDGEGLFHWRTRHIISLPVPEPLANFKVQVWNINWNPDDCIAEAVIPLWGWLEYSRRQYDSSPENRDKWIYKIPRQSIHATHPHNTDQGDIEMEFELLPMTIAQRAEYRAGFGVDGFDASKNSVTNLLPPPARPETSFAWYRIDKQISFRVCLCWKKSKKYLIGALLLFLAIIILPAVLATK